MVRSRSRHPATVTPTKPALQRAGRATTPASRGSSGQMLQASGELRRLALDQIDVPRLRIRRELGAVEDLAFSLGAVGILQPVQVFHTGDRYRLIAGERRLRAAGMLGWTEIDALVREPGGDDLLLELVENAQRKFLTDAEEADAFIRLVRDQGYQIADVGAQAGRSEAYVSKRIRVFEDPILRAAVDREEVSVSMAEEFLTVPAEARPGLVAQAIQERWDMARVRRALRAPRVELELPAPAGPAMGTTDRSSAATAGSASEDVVEGSFHEVDAVAAALPRQPKQSLTSSAQKTPQHQDLIKQLHLVRDTIRDLRPYELTPAEERALAELFQALLRLARARQRGDQGPVFPLLNEAERLSRRR